MWLESGDFSPDANEDGTGQAPEKASEKAREQPSSKALAGISRSRKDESKGKKASDLLSSILIKLLRDPNFDPLLEPIMALLRMDLPSAYIVGILSLVSHEASGWIRRTYDHSLPMIQNEPAAESERMDFNPDRLRPDFKERINEWISDVFLIATKDPSFTLTEKFLAEISSSKPRIAFVAACEAVLIFFFNTKNITVPVSEARSLSTFLLKELEYRLAKMDRSDTV